MLRPLRRIVPVSLNAVRQLAPAAGQLLLAWVVMHRADPAVWGDVVARLVVAAVLGQLLAWGSKDLLLRSFARQPQQTAEAWWANFLARAIGLAPAVVVMAVVSSSSVEGWWWGVWLAARFVGTSFDPVILAHRRFILAVGAEVGAIAAAVGLVATAPLPMQPVAVVGALAAGATLRAASLALGLHRLVRHSTLPRPDLGSLREAASFVLIGLAGTLNSKIDLWLVAALEAADHVGRYHVVTNSLIAVQAAAALLLAPYVRSLYRLSDHSLRRMSWRLVGVGVVIATAGISAARWMIVDLFHFPFDATWVAVSVGFVVPIFIYLPRIYLLFKWGRERQVMLVSVGAAAVNGLATWALLPPLGILGALVGSAVAQVAQTVVLLAMTRHTWHDEPSVP